MNDLPPCSHCGSTDVEAIEVAANGTLDVVCHACGIVQATDVDSGLADAHPGDELATCEKHGVQLIVSAERRWGFAGPIYLTRLGCGCQDVDASADVPEP